MGTARFLLEQNVDGFAFNQAGRSPLSCSIECLPELALFLLKEKSRFEYRWWGNGLENLIPTLSLTPTPTLILTLTLTSTLTPTLTLTLTLTRWGNDLFWFSFNGIILPLQNEQPLQVSDQNGDPTTIEQLIIRRASYFPTLTPHLAPGPGPGPGPNLHPDPDPDPDP